MKKIFFSCLIFFVLLILILVFFRNFLVEYINKQFNPVEVVSNVITKAKELKNTNGITNFLIIGVDTRLSGTSVESGTLTDVLIVASYNKKSDRVTLISIPRDLWIENQCTWNATKTNLNKKTFSCKINSIFSTNRSYYYSIEKINNSKMNIEEDKKAKLKAQNLAIEVLKENITTITGLPIHYYAIIDFNIFKQAIDAVGGVEIDVQNSFVGSEYPIEGKENAPINQRYETVKFTKGIELMNGERALKYARSRHGTYPEGGDFARARRQQQVISALKQKVLNNETLSNPKKLLDLFLAFNENVKSDISITDATVFFSNVSKLKDHDFQRIVISAETKDEQIIGSGLLRFNNKQEREKLHNNQSVLIPFDKTYVEIQTLINEYVYKTNETQNESSEVDIEK